LAGLAMTKNRTGVLAGAAGLVAVALAFRRALPKWMTALVALGVLAGLALVVVLVWHPGMRAAPSALTRFEFLHTRDLEFRTYYWRTAWRIFLSHPVAGTGLDTYYGNYTLHRLVVDGARLGLTELPDKPHSVYLEYAANAGLLGAATYLAFVGATLLIA